jgi:hypothetical protein
MAVTSKVCTVDTVSVMVYLLGVRSWERFHIWVC